MTESRGDYRSLEWYRWQGDIRAYRGARAVAIAIEAGPPWSAMRRAAHALSRAGRDEAARGRALDAVRASFWCVTRTPHRCQPTKSRMAYVIARDDGRCVRCESRRPVLHVDHLYPKSLGGANEVWNLAALCGPCNLKKADHLVPWALRLMVDQAEASERARRTA